MKKRILGISGAISLSIFLILSLVIDHLSGVQQSQQMAERWSKNGDVAQISCFFSVDSNIDLDQIQSFEYSIDNKLAEASVVQESENPGARLWADAYSADGSVSITSDKGYVQTNAIGIGGDFFLFHPMTLVSGSYFSGNDLMQDYCIIDREVAWQLFGASDVAGMTVFIGNVPHIIVGVIERPKGRLAEAAGLDGTLVFVSYKTLTELGQNYGINHYEVVMPNPVTGFAQNVVSESFSSDPNTVEIVENTSRYSLLSRLKLLIQFGLRSMNGKAIIYPYWENIARGYEDILALLTFFELLFLVYALAIALGLFISWWRHKGWTIKDKVLILKDKLERLREKLYAKRQAARLKKEKPAKEKPAKEKPAKEKPAKEKPAKEKPAKEKTIKEKTVKEKLIKKKSTKEKQ